MASHGVPRAAPKETRNAETRAQEAKAIEEYKRLVFDVQEKVEQQDYSPELLQKTGALLQKNPEYYTMWNCRRRIYTNEFQSILKASSAGGITSANKTSQILDIIHLDLRFLFPLLLKFPKCYWIWNHRIWLLEQCSILLLTEEARKIWIEELSLVNKMLTRDSRNFHGWGYRRFIVENLESQALDGSSMAQSEYDYTTKMIKTNLSNFSAWHHRARVIARMLNEQHADATQRREVLDEELKLIHDALFDPYDQSLWFYHQNLMCNFDLKVDHDSIMPHLSKDDKLNYLREEKVFMIEILEDAEDCKWLYQSLIECNVRMGMLDGAVSTIPKAEIDAWLSKLQLLDPLRSGRWLDLRAKLQLD